MGQPGSSATAKVMTLEEWGALDEDVPGELVDGRLEEEEVPDYVHEACVAWLIAVLRTWFVPRGGIVGGSDAKLAVAAAKGRKPDVTAYVAGKLPPRRGIVTQPPFVAVEVLSPSARDVRRDRIAKMDEYAAFGVAYYWIVDPEAQTLEIYARTESATYARVLGAAGGTIESVPGLPGFALSLDELWTELARLADE